MDGRGGGAPDDASALVTRVTEEAASAAVDALLAQHPTGVGVSEFAATEVAEIGAGAVHG